MNSKIQKVMTEIEKVRAKTESYRVTASIQQKTELENTEIVGLVRGLDVSPDELATLIQAIRNGNTGGSPVVLSKTEEQEDMEDEA